MIDNQPTYVLKVKNGSGWRKYSTVRLMISVGQSYHEGSKLLALVDWINRNKEIKKVHISVNDLLQRHNYISAGTSEQRAEAISLAMGTFWIEQNTETLAQIQAETVMTRWEDWLHTEAYANTIKILDYYRYSDPSFNEAVEKDSHVLLDRRLARGEHIEDHNLFIKNSRQYIMEEIAVFALQCADLPAAEVYPGSNLSSLEYLVGKDLPHAIAPLADRYFTRVDFARAGKNQATSPDGLQTSAVA